MSIDDLLKEFDAIIEEAPVDFLGTGSCSKAADREEAQWRDSIRRFRDNLALCEVSQEKVLAELTRMSQEMDVRLRLCLANL